MGCDRLVLSPYDVLGLAPGSGTWFVLGGTEWLCSGFVGVADDDEGGGTWFVFGGTECCGAGTWFVFGGTEWSRSCFVEAAPSGTVCTLLKFMLGHSGGSLGRSDGKNTWS